MVRVPAFQAGYAGSIPVTRSTMIFQHWGSTTEEIASSVAGDSICSNATLIATRSISIAAPPEEVFPWIRQMGMGKAGWYSYDWLDNFGRKSATTIKPEWQNVTTGSKVPGGPVKFEAAIVEPPKAFVLKVNFKSRLGRRLCGTLAYELREDPAGTRLVTRLRTHIDVPGGTLLEQLFLGPGDGIMLRRQLLNVAKRAEFNR
jgi:hypothetical protein